MQYLGILFLIGVAFSPIVSGLYFHMGETERKCFIEEIPDETTVLVKYKVELHDPRTGGFMPSSPGIGMHVEVKDPDMRTILSKMYSLEDRCSFTSLVPGEHVICLYSNSTKWIGVKQLRVHINIQVGVHTIDYANVASKEKLSDLQLRMRQLLDLVDAIRKEQNYQRYREELFRMTPGSTNKLVLWWSLAQLIILVAMGTCLRKWDISRVSLKQKVGLIYGHPFFIANIFCKKKKIILLKI